MYVCMYTAIVYRPTIVFCCVLLPRRMMNNPCGTAPPDFVDLWQKAVASNARTVKTALFMKYLESGKDWAQQLDTQTVQFETHV